MKKKFGLYILLITMIILAAVMCSWEPVQAQTNTTIEYPLVLYKEIDVALGRAGVYFPGSNYAGSMFLSRLNPFHTDKLTFTQRWIDIQLFDSKGQEIRTVAGYAFVYFNLDQESRKVWDQGSLSIFHYNRDKDTWKKCNTRLVADKNLPFGRVRALILKEFGLYGLAIKSK